MAKYEYGRFNETVSVDGKYYEVLNELRYHGEVESGKSRPYLRRSTKLSVFKDVLQYNPYLYSKLSKQDWYEAYKLEVEGLPRYDEEGVLDTSEVVEVIDKEEIASVDLARVVDIIADQNNVSNKKMEGLLSTLTEKVEQITTSSKLEEALIEGIVDKGKELAVDELKDELKTHLKGFIEETYGVLPKVIRLEKEEITYDKTGLFHEQFEKVLKLVDMKLPVMLTGGAGAGKNYMLEQVSDALGLNFYYTSTITQEYKLTGFIDGGGKFHETEFYKAFTGGGVFMLDEIDASIPECLVILNGAIANGYFDFPNGREIAHEDFRVVCAGNTVGLGADMVYTGRNVLDGATLDRFVLVGIDYDKRIIENLCQDETLREFLYDLTNSIKSNKINHIIGMRTFKYAYELLVNNFDKEFIVKSTILKGLQADDINVIKKGMTRQDGEWYGAIK